MTAGQLGQGGRNLAEGDGPGQQVESAVGEQVADAVAITRAPARAASWTA
ncbi:hypothetical protein [Streptomyces deserti]